MMDRVGIVLGLEAKESATGSWSRGWYHYGDVAGLRLVGRPAGCFRTAASAPANPAAMARAAGVTVTG